MHRKTLLFGLIVFFSVSAFPAWAGGGKDGTSLKGMNVVIGNWWGDYDVNTFIPRNDTEEKLLDQRKKFLKDNNFTMMEKALTDWNGMMQIAATSTMAGSPAAQVFLVQPNWAMVLRARGLVAPLSDKVVDVKKPAPAAKGYPAPEWNQATIDSFTFDGKAYGFSFGINTYNANVVFFNKRLFREAGLDPNLPYDMQKDGTWTWENFINICKKLTRDIDNDGIIDTYATTADLSTDFLDAVVASNGATYVDKDPKTGKFVNATGRPEFLEALQFFIRLKDEGVIKIRPEGSNWDWYKGEFTDGKVAMRIDESYARNDFQYMTDDWGMVLFPKGPKSPTYCVYTRDNIMVIPSTYKSDEVDKILWALALWYTPVNTDWKSPEYNMFRDTRAVDETLELIRTPKMSMIKYYTYINGLERGDIAWNLWWFEGEPSQLVESVSQSWNALIDDANSIN